MFTFNETFHEYQHIIINNRNMSDSIKKWHEMQEENKLEKQMNQIDSLTHEINSVGQTIQSKMKIEDWRTYGEVQYLKGRLDELNKIDNLVSFDMPSIRIVDARISKYLDKLQAVSPLAFELYHIEKDNIKHTLQRENKKTTKPSNSKDSN